MCLSRPISEKHTTSANARIIYYFRSINATNDTEIVKFAIASINDDKRYRSDINNNRSKRKENRMASKLNSGILCFFQSFTTNFITFPRISR